MKKPSSQQAARNDIRTAQNVVTGLTREADHALKLIGQDPAARKSKKERKMRENDVIVNFCLQSAYKMLELVPLRHQKNFARKLSDKATANLTANLKSEQAQELKSMPVELIALQDDVEKTLEKVRSKFFKRSAEASQLLGHYNSLLDKELSLDQQVLGNSSRRSRQQIQPVVDVAKVKKLTGQVVVIEHEKDKI